MCKDTLCTAQRDKFRGMSVHMEKSSGILSRRNYGRMSKVQNLYAHSSCTLLCFSVMVLLRLLVQDLQQSSHGAPAYSDLQLGHFQTR